jgi:hypothetical protein
MKDVTGLYKKDLFKLRCGEVKYGDADDTTPQRYIPYNRFPNDSVVVINYHLHRESSMNLMIIVILGFAGC